MRIVVIGGLASSLINFRGPLLEAMVDRGHEVIACAPDAPKDVRVKLAGMAVEYCHVPIERSGMNPAGDLWAALSLFRIFQKRQPNIVLGYTAKPVVWGCLAARAAQVPASFAMIEGLGYAFIGDDSFKQRFLHHIVIALYRAALSHTKAVFFLNPDDLFEFRKKRLLSTSTQSVRINGIGVDLKHYSPASLPKSPVFLLMARLLADKGIREYREAARRIRARYPDARFLLAGGFDSNPAAIKEAEIRKWKEEGSLDYLGELDDVRPALAQSRIYVLPSYREGTPRTVLEAMSTGRPIITTDAPGCRETVQDGVNGFLVPVKDAGALSLAMEKFITKPDLAESMGKESRRIAEEKYDVHKVNQVILSAMGL